MAPRRSRQRRPARRPGTRQAHRRLLVVCEGRVTEPSYILGFERWIRNAAVEVVIPEQAGDPKRLVEIAKERSKSARREAERTQDNFLAYDETWCVFDRDEHTRFHDACQMARDNGIRVAASNPCFELWLLMHFRDSPGARERRDLPAMLKEHLPEYSKEVDFNELRAGYRLAVERARRLDVEAGRVGEAGRNPSTGVYRLTESIERTP